MGRVRGQSRSRRAVEGTGPRKIHVPQQKPGNGKTNSVSLAQTSGASIAREGEGGEGRVLPK